VGVVCAWIPDLFCNGKWDKVSKRKTAQRATTKKSEPVSKRRWLIINKETGQPTYGCWNALTHGISRREEAERQSKHLVIETEVVLAHVHFNQPDPDAE